MTFTRSLFRQSPTVLFAVPCLCMLLGVGNAAAQDSTVFADDFQSYRVGTFARGCGDMTAGSWRWESHHYHACYSAGWGVSYAQLASGVQSTDKRLRLWGGVPYGGGGDCAVTVANSDMQGLSDYSVTAVLSPIRVVNGSSVCKTGMCGIAGRVQQTKTFCSGYLLALALNNGESICEQGSFLQLFANNRGPYCNGSEDLTLLASQEVDISADLGGNFAPDQQYVMKLCFSGSDIYGGVWTVKDWDDGEGSPLAEVIASDETFATGTFGLYQGASLTNFDNVVVTVGGECMTLQPSALEAELDFDPNTLNTKSKGKYVTCYIELPPDYDPWDIDVATVMLNDVVPAELKPTGVGDNDGDGVDDRMVKFDRGEVIALLSGAADAGATSGGAEFSGISGGAEFGLGGDSNASMSWGSDEPANGAPSSHGDSVDVWVSGLLVDGTAFVGTDKIRVIAPGNNGVGNDALNVTPSPVKGRASIGFTVNVDGPVRLCVFDAAGRLVHTLVSEYKAAGDYETTWDRTTRDGRRVGPGVYFMKLDQPGNTSVQKLMVIQ